MTMNTAASRRKIRAESSWFDSDDWLNPLSNRKNGGATHSGNQFDGCQRGRQLCATNQNTNQILDRERSDIRPPALRSRSGRSTSDDHCNRNIPDDFSH